MKLSNSLYKIISGICILLQTVSLVNIAESTGIAKPVPLADQEVSVGQPSLWSFAQAHYLLASLRERSQAIETKGLTTTELDPYAVNKTSIDMLKSIFGADVEFDQAKGTQNQLKLQQHQQNLQRSNQLLATLDQRRNQYIESVRELSLLQTRRTQLNAELPSPLPAQPPPDVMEKQKEIQKLDRLITIKTAERDALNADITVINDQLKTLDTALSSTELQSVFANDTSPVPQFTGLLSKADIQAILGADKSPRLSASTALDSYIQLQYELIAKQLTLLRDEVGPNQRVIFLELPCSIYISPKTANDSLAQVRWKVTKYLKKTAETSAASSQPKALSIEDAKNNAAKFQKVDENAPAVQVLDIIPRQSALNVAEVHNTVNGFNLSAKLVWLFGLGTKVGYQRQRELYNQFIYQEIFASGFGKGEGEFGWTFGPLPGTKAIAPGLRTTYAVLSVPREAEAIELEGKGFSFSRKLTPDASVAGASTKCFTLLIPREGNGFNMTGIDYVPVKSGEYLTAILRGNYFSPQVGVLINGLPLSRVVAIASTPKGVRPAQNKAAGADPPPVDPPSPPAGADVFDGQYEYISSETVILKWKMPVSYEGTPVMTLVTPDFTSNINQIPLVINGIANQQLNAVSVTNPMFFKELAITNIQINRILADDMVKATVQGNGFKPGASIAVNGIKIHNPVQTSPQSYEIEFKRPFAQNWNFSMMQTLLQKTELAVFNLQPGSATITYEISNFDPPTGTDKAKMDLRIHVGAVKDFILRAKNQSEASVTHLGSANEAINYQIETSKNPIKLEMVRGGIPERTLILYWPLEPSIDKIINESEGPEGTASGKTTGGYRVRIKGQNLQLVNEVKFDATVINQIQEQTNETIIISVPPGQGKVFVTLKTPPILDGTPLTNQKDWDKGKGFFTYIAPPAQAVAQNSP